MKDFVFVSGNLDKVYYLEMFLGRKVEHHKLDIDEIQSLQPDEVIEHKARSAFKILKKPVLVEDTSLSIEALGGLPGPFVKFFLSTVGVDGICRLTSTGQNRSAVATVAAGYYDGKNFHTFKHDVKGMIADEPRGSNGMGWDSTFIPAGQPKTYGEMNETELAKYSVRNKVVKKLKRFLAVD